MAFDEVRFPENIALGMTGGPMFNTDIVELYSGYEKRNANWSMARSTYNASHAVKTPAQLATLIAFFRGRQGRANGFRFRDWSDYSAIGQPIATGDGTTRIFQLIKTYTSGAVTVTRTINKPVQSGNQVTTVLAMYLNAVHKTEGTDFTVDYTTGLVTFASAPLNTVAITADFEFDVPVRFDTDQLNSSIDYYKEFSWPSIPLIEVRI